MVPDVRAKRVVCGAQSVKRVERLRQRRLRSRRRPGCPRPSRSTTTWVIGSSISSRARSTTPPSSQRERLRRMGRDHDLVGREDPQRVLDRDVRVGVADLAPRLQPEPLVDFDQRELHPLPRELDRFVDVGGPVRGPRGGQRRRDDEDLAAARPRQRSRISSSSARSADGLVGDHQQAVAAVAAPGERDAAGSRPRESR